MSEVINDVKRIVFTTHKDVSSVLNRKTKVLASVNIAKKVKEKLGIIKILEDEKHDTIYTLGQFYKDFPDEKYNDAWNDLLGVINDFEEKSPKEKKDTVSQISDYLNDVDEVTQSFAIDEIAKITSINKALLRKQIKNCRINPNKFKFKEIQSFFDKRDLARKFLEIQPLFYDKGRNFWAWDNKDCNWDLVDEIDILNDIDKYAQNVNTIDAKEKNQIIEALKQEGRKAHPQPIAKTWVQFKDKIIDVKNGDIIESTPDYFATNPIPWKLGVSKETPNIDALFKEWVGEEHITTLKEIASYCMLPDYPIHRIFCFLGSGRNGKSRYLAFVDKLIGEKNVSAVELDRLMESRFEAFGLYKKLVVQMGETNFSTMKRTAILKNLSGQDKISFEAKNKDPIKDVNYAKLMISTNNLPETEDKSDGFYRRWLCVDFPNKFPEGKDVLEKIPQEEYSNFCAQAIKILQRLVNEGRFTYEGSVEDKQKMYEERSNPFQKFLVEECIIDPEKHITKFQFKQSIQEWCRYNKYRIVTDHMIKNKMQQLDIEEKKMPYEAYDKDTGRFTTKYTRSWVGIALKNEKNKEDDSIKEKVDVLQIIAENPINNHGILIEAIGKKKLDKLLNDGELYHSTPTTIKAIK